MKLSESVRGNLRFFAFYLANRTVDLEVLPKGIDYSCVFVEPSVMEQAFAIWGNVIELGTVGKALNGSYAQHRAAQYIRGYVDREYVIDPPFADWELELYM